MTYDDLKKYLSRLFFIRLRIIDNEQELEKLRHLFYAPKGVSYGERVQVSVVNNHRESEILDSIDRVENKITDERLKFIKVYEELRDLILKVEDERYILVLKKRYLELLTWETIAEDMDCTYQNCHKLHRESLEWILNNNLIS